MPTVILANLPEEGTQALLLDRIAEEEPSGERVAVESPGLSMLAAMPERKDKLIGPRGGETTRKPGQVKKTVWLNEDEAEALRKAAFDRRVSEAALIREAVRRLFGISD